MNKLEQIKADRKDSKAEKTDASSGLKVRTEIKAGIRFTMSDVLVTS
jgi:hypothetical protein